MTTATLYSFSDATLYGPIRVPLYSTCHLSVPVRGVRKVQVLTVGIQWTKIAGAEVLFSMQEVCLYVGRREYFSKVFFHF